MRITVITAAYKAERTIGDAIASVAAQDHPDLEHLVIEGASPDGTREAALAAAHPRMVLRSEADDGIYDALNKGIRQATGEVIGFVHSDDFLADSGVLSRIAEAFADPMVEAVYSDLDYVAASDPARVVRHWVAGEWAPGALSKGWMPPHPTLYLRRAVHERVGLYDTEYGISADYDLILRYFPGAGDAVRYLPGVTYKMRTGGVSNRSLRHVARKMHEDLRALRRHEIGGIATLAAKSLRKLPQVAGGRAVSGARTGVGSR